MLKKTILSIYLLVFFLPIHAQICTYTGQTPQTALLVCGTESFYSVTPTYCGIMPIPVPCAATYQYQNRNPNFFRMNCFNSGTLGFTIDPDEPTADYNWQLFDITNINPDAIFTIPGLLVACNWSAEPGQTGATADGLSLNVCGGGGEPVYSKMPDIIAGRAYLLMVSNYSSSSLGYNITFTGGSASITDDVIPRLQSATGNCNATQINLRLNKKISCTSIASDGSDFISNASAMITDAVPGDCSLYNSTDSVIISFNQPLSVGNYTLTIRTGSDGNTLKDICNREISSGETINFSITAPQPTIMDSLVPIAGCSPAFVDLFFRKNIRCSSIAADGSDFRIVGPQAVNFMYIPGNCSTSIYTRRIRLQFQSPIITGGTYQVFLSIGTDGNSLVDECGQAVIQLIPLTFTINSPLSSLFTIQQPSACKRDSILFFHNGNNNANTWQWNFGDGTVSTFQNPVHWFNNPGTYRVSLTVQNGICSDSSSQLITIGDHLKASFKTKEEFCIDDSIHLINTSTGIINEWKWIMGDGNVLSVTNPANYRYRPVGFDAYYTISLIATNTQLMCNDTAKKTIKVLNSCLIKVPTAFTPNGDGLNDFLYPLNALKAIDMQFRIYNRQGQLVFMSRQGSNKWDGKVKGVLQQTGIYVWLLNYINSDTGQPVFMKGTTLLIR